MKRIVKNFLVILLAIMLIMGTKLSLYDLEIVKVYGETWEEWNYSVLEDGSIEITGFNGLDTEIVIPSEIEAYKITSIGKYTFSGYNDLTSIELPLGLTSIGDSTF